MKIAKYLTKLFVIQIILLIFSLYGYAFEKPTHFAINEYIAKNIMKLPEASYWVSSGIIA